MVKKRERERETMQKNARRDEDWKKTLLIKFYLFFLSNMENSLFVIMIDFSRVKDNEAKREEMKMEKPCYFFIYSDMENSLSAIIMIFRGWETMKRSKKRWRWTNRGFYIYIQTWKIIYLIIFILESDNNEAKQEEVKMKKSFHLWDFYRAPLIGHSFELFEHPLWLIGHPFGLFGHPLVLYS